MNTTFAKHVGLLDAKVDALLSAQPYRYDGLPRAMPLCGIYLFSDGKKHLYVGRSRRIRKRLSNHCRQSAPHNQASFAFLLAREHTGHVEASYSSLGSRAALCNDPVFKAAFEDAKARLRSLSIRYVEESDPITQALLEIYASIRLKTRYNSFDTH